jgi:hypothetical protein
MKNQKHWNINHTELQEQTKYYLVGILNNLNDFK